MKALLALCLTLFVNTPASAQSLPGGLSLPLHGNWCGAGHSGGPYALPPTDLLDAACMRHDICTGQRGRFDCGCDISFMQELRGQHWPGPGIGAKARAIYDTIAIMPCSDPNGMSVKSEMFMNDWAKGVLSGREAPWDVMRRLGYLGREGAGNSFWGGY